MNLLRSTLLALAAFIAAAAAPASAQVTYVTQGAAGGNGSASVTLAAAPAVDDLLVAHVGFQPADAALTVTGSGWTALRTDDSPAGCSPTEKMNLCVFASRVYYKTHASGDPSDYTFTVVDKKARVTAGISVYRGVDAAAPILAHGATASADEKSNTVTAPALAVSAPVGAHLLALFAANGETTFSSLPPTYVSRYSAAQKDGTSVAGTTRGPLAAAETPTAQTAATGIMGGAANVGVHIVLKPVGFTHYAIGAPAGTSFATCETIAVRFAAHDDAHTEVAAPSGTVTNLSTSTGTGVWQAFSAGAGDLGVGVNFVPSGLNNGMATYTWSGSETELRVRLRQTTATTFNVNVSDGARSENAGEDPAFTVDDSVVRVTADGASTASVGTQIAGKPSNTGAGAQTLFVQAVRSATPTVCAALFQNQTVNVDFAWLCENPAACSAAAGTAAEVRNNALSYVSVAKNNGPGAPAAYTPVALTFSNDANAMAPLVFRYGDAGMGRLYMRAPLPAPPANTFALGSSNSFVVRPFGLFVAAAQGADHTSPVLAAAGDPFTLSVSAYQWAAGEDEVTGDPLLGANITDNGTTPSFAANATLTPVANLAGPFLGAVARGAGCAGAGTIGLVGGTATAADWCYSEAGNVLLRADVTDYLAVGVNVMGGSGLDDTDAGNGHVGRFKPKHFAVAGAAMLTHRAALACAPAATFTYMNEGLSLGFTLEARNAQDALTRNYRGAYARLDLSDAASLGIGAVSGAANLTARVDAGLAPSGSFTDGIAVLAVTTGILRATPDNPDGAYAATQFGIAPNDADGVAMGTLDLDVDGVGGDDHFAIGPVADLRFGRLTLQNAYGSATVALPMPLEVQYWDGAQFQRNADDSCTTLAAAGIGLSGYKLNLGPGETAIVEATIAFTAGSGGLTMSPPGAANNGSVLLTPDLAVAGRTYLRGRWGGATWDQDPSATAAFGLYGSQPKNFIFFRENY